MATLEELGNITNDTNWGLLAEKVRAAAAIKAASIINSATPTAGQLAWAKSAINNPKNAGDDIIFYVISANAGATVAQIFSAPDTAIQNNVNDAVDKLSEV
jgi:hypothetical protein